MQIYLGMGWEIWKTRIQIFEHPSLGRNLQVLIEKIVHL